MISAPPALPDRNNSDTFPALADAYLSWISNSLHPAFNADIAALNTNDTRDASTSSVLIGTGSKTFTVSAGKSFSGGQWLTIADTAAPSTNSMVGQVTSYSGTTLVVNVPANGVFGSGTKTAWVIALSAAPSAAISAAMSAVVSAATLAAARSAMGVQLEAGALMPFASKVIPVGWLKANGAAVSRTTYADLYAALVQTAAVTMTIASPGVVTWTAHGLSANDPVRFSTTGALPTGFAVGTVYYVVGASITTNTFTLSATVGGAAINTTGAQSGVHTAIYAPYGVGDGSTTFNVPDLRGEFLRGWDDGRGVDASRTIGNAQTDLYKTHTHGRGDIYSGGSANNPGANISSASSTVYYTNGGGPLSADSGGTAASGGVETRPRNIAVVYCIKY